jgi:outer membrane receptor for ferrienterochelin and colicin
VEGVPTPPIADKVDSFSTIGTAGRVTFGVLTGQWFYHQRHQIVPVGVYGTAFNDPRTTVGEQRFAGEIRFEPRLGKNLMLFTRVHANDYNSPLVLAVGPDEKYEETYSGTWLGAEARVMYTPLRWLRFTVGAEGQAHLRAGMQGATVTATGREPYVNEQRPYSFGAVYAIAEGSPKTWFRFSAGTRVNMSSTFGAVVVPRVAFIFRPGQDHTIKIMGGRAFRAASVYEQYYNDGGLTQAVAQDPARGLSLSPESSYSGEIEYSARFLSHWNALATVHTTLVDHIIELGPDAPNSEVVRYANSSTLAVVAGGDVELRREWRRGTMFGASYGFQRAQKLDSTASNSLLENVPLHLASIRFVTPILQDIASVGFRATLEAPRRIRADSDDVTSTAIVADATLSGSVFDTGIRYVVGVYNLGDWHYEVATDSTFASRTMPQNGRRFLLDLQWTLR